MQRACICGVINIIETILCPYQEDMHGIHFLQGLLRDHGLIDHLNKRFQRTMEGVLSHSMTRYSYVLLCGAVGKKSVLSFSIAGRHPRNRWRSTRGVGRPRINVHHTCTRETVRAKSTEVAVNPTSQDKTNVFFSWMQDVTSDQGGDGGSNEWPAFKYYRTSSSKAFLRCTSTFDMMARSNPTFHPSHCQATVRH